MTTTPQSVAELASLLNELNKDKATRVAAPQLATSSVEGDGVNHYDAAGQIVARVGMQHDGTAAAAALAGPVPPAPLGVDATGGQLTVTATWDGTFVDDAVAPMDFARVEVHQGATEDFTVDPLPTSTTRVGSIEHAGGGSFTWTQQPGDVWVTMITRSATGKASEPLAHVMVEVDSAVDPAVFEQAAKDLADARTRLSAAEGSLSAARGDLYDAGGRVDVLKSTLSGQITAGDSATAASAAADATSKTAAVRAETLSRGTDLVTNGTGALGTNYNFTTFTEFSTSDTPSGTYRSWSDSPGARARYLDETVSIDVTKAYTLSAWVKQAGTSTTSLAYLAIAPVDQYGLVISPSHTAFIAGTTTTLAADLKPGDTTMKLADPTNWYGAAGKPAGASITYRRGIIPWNYVDAGGKAWPAQTYSRNTLFDLWDDGGVAADGTVTLKKPWAGRLIPAGTPLSNSDSGSGLIYPVMRVVKPAEGWVRLVGTPVTGTVTDGRIPDTAKAWPPGTAACRVAVLENYTYDTTNSKHMWAGFSLSDATAAYNQAVSATSKADAAQATANTAKSSADTAKSAADTAQSTANTAKADAAAAAGIANGKGDVLIQPAAPTAAMQKATTLWIDTTNSANTPKRWSGSAWVVVTDKAATDAASAAAAAQATANTAKAAADTADAKAVQAQNTATQARADAATAKGAADAAQATASGKNTVLWNTTDPDTSNGAATNTRAGDIWNRYQLVNNKLMILATWQSDGTRWNPSALAESYLPQVNIGTGTYGELDGLRLKAKSVQANAVLVEGSVGSTLIADGAITSAKANINDLAASVGAIMNLDVGQLTVTEKSTFSTAVAQRMFVDIFAANKISANEINVASLATAVLSAQNATINGRLAIGPGGSLVAGDISSSYTILDELGLRTVIVGDDGQQVVVTSIGQGAANALSTSNAAGELTSSVTPDGDAAFTSVTSAGDVMANGRPLLGKRLDSGADDGILDDACRGAVAYGDLRPMIDASKTLPVGYTPLAVIGATIDAGRVYQMSMPFRMSLSNVAAGARAGIAVYRTLKPVDAGDADEPSTSSTFLGDYVDSYASNIGGVTNQVDATWTPVARRYNTKILVCAWSTACQITLSAYNPFDWNFWLTDIGPAVESSARLLDLPTSGQTTSDTTTTTAPPAKKTYTATWHATDSREYLGDGSQTPSNARLVSGHIRHGRAYGSPNNLRGVVVFNAPSVDGEKKYMSTALTGATIMKTEVFIKVKMWSYSTGGTLTLRPLNGTTPPITVTVPSTTQSKRYTGPNQGLWIQVPTSWFGPDSRGIIVGPARTESATDYGYWYTHTAATVDMPKVRHTYVRG